MNSEDRFDKLIRKTVENLFPALLLDLGPHAWLWIKAQIWQESRMNPFAVSTCGAQGLMQLMPATDQEIDGDLDGSDVLGNVDNGIRYLADQYERLVEVSPAHERIRFAMASYNGGRGYINKAFELAREACGLPKSHAAWKRAGCPTGQWQTWAFTHQYLADERCQVKGKRPDHVQICGYVAHIETRFRHYQKSVV